jgi:hypothetical protein
MVGWRSVSDLGAKILEIARERIARHCLDIDEVVGSRDDLSRDGDAVAALRF